MTEGPRRPTQHVESVLAVFPSPLHARDTSDNPDRLMPADPEDLADALAFALRHNGRKRVRYADELMSAIVARRLVDHIERAGFVIMRRPPIGGSTPPYQGGDAA